MRQSRSPGASTPPRWDGGPARPPARSPSDFARRAATPSWRAIALVTLVLTILGWVVGGPHGFVLGVSIAYAFATDGRLRPMGSPSAEAPVDTLNSKDFPPFVRGERKASSAHRANGAAEPPRHPSSSPPPDPGYALPGVSPEATPQEIRRAYRRLARLWHPDRLEKGSAAERARATDRLVLLNSACERLLAVAESRYRARPPR